MKMISALFLLEHPVYNLYTINTSTFVLKRYKLINCNW